MQRGAWPSGLGAQSLASVGCVKWNWGQASASVSCQCGVPGGLEQAAQLRRLDLRTTTQESLMEGGSQG